MTAGLAVLSIGSQGLLPPSVSTGKTTNPGKGVADGISVGVEVGSAVNVGGIEVGGIDEGVTEGGTEIKAGAHPLAEIINKANTRMNNANFFMKLSPFDLR